MLEKEAAMTSTLGSSELLVAVAVHHAKMLHEGIAGSRLVIIKGADHALNWTHAGELVRLTEDFLGA